MQKAEIVLTMLNQKSLNDSTYTFPRLYRNLFNPDFYLNAYAKMYGKEGNMTEGVDGKSIDGFGMQTVTRLIEQVKYERYNPQPVRRVFIPKKNGKMRPLGIPTIEDKLIQEVLREILEAIYEPLFNTNSHGFRPNRSCHTALSQIKKTGNGSAWIIEGDIKGFFDNIDHEILLNILGKKIDDGRFISLIGKFLKAGIMEEGKLRDSSTGTPQGGIISPLLANIYLNELDQFMETLKEKLEKGDIKKHNPKYRMLANQRQSQLQKGDYKLARETQKQLRQTPTKDQMDENFRRIRYVRYADDFVILLHGTKSFSKQIRAEIAVFLKENLKLELNLEKTLITNLLNEKARFLGYEIIKGMENTRLTKSDKGIKYRAVNGVIQLLVPADVINEKIKLFSKNGKPSHINERINMSLLEMLTMYNSEIRGLYNYYSLANNVSKRLDKFMFYHYYSLVKTLARKHKISVNKTIKKFGIPIQRKIGTGTRNIIGAHYETKEGTKTAIYFNDSLKRKQQPLKKLKTPNEIKVDFKNEIIRRILNGYCELCGEKNLINSLEVHQIRNLKKMKEKYKNKSGDAPNWLKLMIRIRRKTLVLCKNCHKEIHR